MVRIVFGLPPRNEQRRIVEEIDRRFSVIDELELQIEHNLRRAERLRQALLKRAFEGKLVPQDPNDAPASLLLERIRSERDAKSDGVRPKGQQRKVAVP
jgi:type I restriction enzyme S subunit